MQVLVTGANGFVGRALCSQLLNDGHAVRRLVRRPSGEAGEIVVPEWSSGVRWREVLGGVEVVVHLAARVHVMREEAADPAQAFHLANCVVSRELANASAQNGVRRFVLMSSIKVNGEGGTGPYRESDLALPEDHYARSKRDAEQAVRDVAADSGMEAVVLRPPLVYGPRVRGNFLRLLQAIDKGYPLPLGCVQARRSLVYLGNLVDAIALVMHHPAAHGVFLVRDGEDLSSADLAKRLAHHLRRRARLLPVPVSAMHLVGRVFRRSAAVNRLVGSLQLDDSRLRTVLGWRPPWSVDAGLEQTVHWYLGARSSP